MTNFDDSVPKGHVRSASLFYFLFVIIASVCAIFLTFVLANSSAGPETKAPAFLAIIVGFLAVCLCLHLRQTRCASQKARRDLAADLQLRTESGLRMLDEANEFFAGSIKPADMFRLVSSRIREFAAFRTCAFLLLDETRSHLRVAGADGPDAERLKNKTFAFDACPLGTCFRRRSVEISNSIAGINGEFCPVAAIPLLNRTEAFGVLLLYFDSGSGPDERDASLFEAIGTRVAPLVLSSIALERSMSNALTDATTDLPNERAFYLVLENHIAETQRKRDDRPLTILAIDIKNFDDINQRFGHAAGDRVLTFVAHIIKDNLRQMDFLARSLGDEFLAILPTASREISHDVIARIDTGFFGRKLKVNDDETVEIELNFGWAAFGNDGETSGALLSIARQRKEQAKSTAPSKVLWFPQELVN